MRLYKTLAVALLFSCLNVTVADTKIDFNRDIRPLLSDKCYQCHGPDEGQREAELRLDVATDAFARRDGYAVVVAGDPDQSALIARITSDDADERMPPADSGKVLTADEIELLTRWIQEGASWESHWSFASPTTPKVPGANGRGWGHNEIDRFIAAILEAESLAPSPEADRRTLIRRLYLDLTGLPPSIKEVRRFVCDDDPKAYEHLVDRLLRSPHYGERMATAWLDAARYADTNGYSIDGGRHMWLWRDWVIDAYNKNMPYDQFTVEQIAGDLLPEATVAQKIATGFNRNHMITHEGGTIPAENLVNYVSDRVKTTSQVFLGLTMGCAQCHDHKYDPISQRDYYRFFAYFNSVEERGLDGDAGVNASPKIKASAFLIDRAASELDAAIQELEEQLRQPHPAQAEWEDEARRHLIQRGCNLEIHPLKVLKVTSPNRGDKYDVLEDGTVFLPNSSGRSPSISMQVQDIDQLTGLRIEFLTDEKFPDGRTGHGKKHLRGSFLLTSFSASATSVPSDQVDLYKMQSYSRVTASASHDEHPPADCLDPRDHNGWSPYPHDTSKQHITFTFDQPLDTTKNPFITVMLVWGGGKYGGGLSAGKYRICGITGNDDGTDLPADIQEIVQLSAKDRTALQAARLQTYYCEVAPQLAHLRHRIASLRQHRQDLKQQHEVMVMNVAEQPRKTHILNRGQYDQPLDEVSPGTPSALPPLPESAPANRLGLAQWLVRPENPLTSRVAVNRLWQMLFGTGLVATAGDFGSQGDHPSHPELLDWLALEFVDCGWDVKSMTKRIVMSATYRQSSKTTPELLARDPNNRLLARGPRFRLQAEFIRDNALQISGLLVPRVGGPSVKPYQPAGLWREVSHYGSTPATAQVFVQDHGDELYRRGLYTFWKRTVPPPSMLSFDAPNREICTVSRETTNTPLQALVLLNETQYVEASRAFARRIVKHSSDDTDRIRFAFESATSRIPNDRELSVLQRTLARERRAFSSDRSAAEALLKVGESPRDVGITASEHAAWTTVASLILNLSETITKR